MDNIIQFDNSDTCAMIEQYAFMMATPEQIACLLSFDCFWFKDQLRNPDSKEHKAYQRGLLRVQMKLNEVQLTLALSGSPSALDYVSSKLSDMTDNL